ncbi:hypothetical protein SUGI_0086580 [Cryptomeria japonica]|uniref:uncharacterized protein At4g26485 isoform X2 n=1 Tax=Cryptomeria japonica TaxID=3369 RepID=UPI002408D8AB|nr:uncharacterized protein At4g26485 isoform X2 [Cryptomeria japonica]GLJ08328.1 hypothetical protein SUGI_0086580 [Cryptomeria japonica]
MMEQIPYGSTIFQELQRQIDGAVLAQRFFPFQTMHMHYSSLHRILLVGEGDFSFSSSLATAFGSAENIVATSLDTKEMVLTFYKSAGNSISNLLSRGACVLHEVDATMIDQLGLFRGTMFDRIVFNFPHSGFWGKEYSNEVIQRHRDLVSKFFRSARMLVSCIGEIHVSHKEGPLYRKWNLVGEAMKSGLFLKECVTFSIADYPGYTNKRGSGVCIDESFPLGDCKTYKFMLTPAAFIEKELMLVREQSYLHALQPQMWI